MRTLYIDIDSLRPDHLGCYGYHRNTSPNIDRVAAEGVRFEQCYVSDAPCLPSRTALFTGRFGIHNGVINQGGAAADPYPDGASRRFRSSLGRTSWMQCLRQAGGSQLAAPGSRPDPTVPAASRLPRAAGLKTVTVSPFGERHSAWHWYAGFSEVYNTGKGGLERADEIAPPALDWIRRNGRDDGWFLHVNFWDPHTPYRTPEAFGDPFADAPLPAWLTEEVRQQHWRGCGPHSAREVTGYGPRGPAGWSYPRQPTVIDSMAEVRRMFDGYDTGVRYADEHVGRILNALADAGVLDETLLIIAADHGENLGELNVYGDHQTADLITTRVPLIVRSPGGAPRVDTALHYQVDFAATLVELLGAQVPPNWDGASFAPALRNGAEAGRDFLVVSQGAWSCQRSVRFDDFLCIRSYHDGYHGFPDAMLYDVKRDPHQQRDLAPEQPERVARAMQMLDAWHGAMMRGATHGPDPMWTVLREGGPEHTRGHLPGYLQRLRETGRDEWADRLTAMHPREALPAGG